MTKTDPTQEYEEKLVPVLPKSVTLGMQSLEALGFYKRVKVPKKENADEKKILEMLPRDTALKAVHIALFKLLPKKGMTTDWMEVMEEADPFFDYETKDGKTYVRNKIYDANEKIRKMKQPIFFRFSKGVVTRLR